MRPQSSKNPGTVELQCEQCGETFFTWRYKVKRGQRCCSPACFHERRRTGITGPTITIQCVVCGKDFQTWPYRLGDGAKYCSQKCVAVGKVKGQTQQCPVCGNDFYVTRNRQGIAIYCSKKCHAVAMRQRSLSDPKRFGGHYKLWRTAVYQRDHYTCQDCGQSRHNLHAHHIKSWTGYPALRFEVENGITLCRDCHYRRHSRQAKRPLMIQLPLG